MAVKAMEWVWEHSRSKGAARLVLLAIADEAHSSGELTAHKRSQSALARKCNLTENSVRLAIKALVKLGELEVLAVGIGRAQTDYRMTFHAETPQNEGTQPEGADPSKTPPQTPQKKGSDPSKTTPPSSRSSRSSPFSPGDTRSAPEPPPPDRATDEREEVVATRLGTADYDEAVARGQKIRDKVGYKRACIHRWRVDPLLRSVLEAHPEATYDELVRRVQAKGAVTESPPAWVADPDCPWCEGSGWTLDDLEGTQAVECDCRQWRATG